MRRGRDEAAAAAEKGKRGGAEAACSGLTRAGRAVHRRAALAMLPPLSDATVRAGEVEGQAGAVYVAAAAVGARRGSGQE